MESEMKTPFSTSFSLLGALFAVLVGGTGLLHGCGRVQVSPMGRAAESLLPFASIQSVTDALAEFDQSKMRFTNKNVTFEWGYVAPNVKDKEYEWYFRYTCATKGDVDSLYLFFNADDELVAMDHEVPSGTPLLPFRPNTNGGWRYLRGN